MIGDARGDADGATTRVQSRRSVIDWTSLWDSDVIFSSTRQETHQGIKIYSLHLKSHFSFASFCLNHRVKNETAQVLLDPLSSSFARLSQYAAKPADLDVAFASTIRKRWALCRKPKRKQERAFR